MQPYSNTHDYQGDYNNATNNYNQAANNTMAAQNQLSSYRQNMQDPSQMYSQHLGEAQSMYGFNPQDLMRAQKNLAGTQTTIANLPQATQQQGNYYGTTAGAQSNNYSQQAGNLQAVLSGQTNAVGAYKDILGATQDQANQQSTLGYQGQQLQSQILQNIMTNALGFQGHQQSMVGNAQAEQSGYGDYLNAQKQAQAALTTASSGAALAQQQAAQIAYNIELQRQYQEQQAQAAKPLTVQNASGLSLGQTGLSLGPTFNGRLQ